MIRTLPFLLAAASWGAADSSRIWVGTWTTAPQLVESSNMPPSPGLANGTLRQVVRVSVGGDTLRLRLSNEFGTSPTTVSAATVALSRGSGAVDASSMVRLAFGGQPSTTLAAGTAVWSDPFVLHVPVRGDLAISLAFGQVSSSLTGHPGSRTTSWIVSGDKSAAATLSGATGTEHWYAISGLDVRAPATTRAVAILGNSIADGRGSTTDRQNRWPDVFSQALLARAGSGPVAVLNQGIGGNCVVSGGLGPTGQSRYARDILGQSGVKWVVVSEGVNDIGNGASASNLIAAYGKMVSDARAAGLRVYGATIMPFKGNSYYTASNEANRQAVNAWIRTAGNFDAVIDFDKLMRDASDTAKLGVATFQNDGLHPDSAGYRRMGNSIDLSLFDAPLSTLPHRSGTGFRDPILRMRDGRLEAEFGGHGPDGRPASP